jgi:hypothetical protein
LKRSIGPSELYLGSTQLCSKAAKSGVREFIKNPKSGVREFIKNKANNLEFYVSDPHWDHPIIFPPSFEQYLV